MGGGGGTTTTNPNIPAEFMPYLTPLIQSSAGYMSGLQDYFWGPGGEGQGYDPSAAGVGGWGYEDQIPGQTYPGIPNQDVYPTIPGGYVSYPDDYASHVGGGSTGPVTPGGNPGPPSPPPSPPTPPPTPPTPPTPPPTPPTPPPEEPPTIPIPPRDGGDRQVPLPPGETPPLPPPPPPDDGGGYTTPSGEPPWSEVDWSTANAPQSTSAASSMSLQPSLQPGAGVTGGNMNPLQSISMAVENQDPDGSGNSGGADESNPGGGQYGPGTGGYTPTGIGIQEENARDVSDASIDQRRAGQMANAMAAPSQGESAAWGGLGDLYSMENQMATGYGMANDPAIQATYDTFAKFSAPMIQDNYSQMGLGRSSDKNEALSLGLADMLMPSMQGYLDRQTGMIDRNVGIYGNAIQSGLGLANQELTRQGAAFDALSQSGETQRSIDQEKKDAYWEDFMRRSALGENALNGPFGGIVPSSIGTTVKSSGGK